MTDRPDLSRIVQAQLPNTWHRRFDDYARFYWAAWTLAPLTMDLFALWQSGAPAFGWSWTVGIAVVGAAGIAVGGRNRLRPRILRRRAEQLEQLHVSGTDDAQVFRGHVVGAADPSSPILTKIASFHDIDISSQPFLVAAGGEFIVVDTAHIDVFMGLPRKGIRFRSGDGRLVAYVGARLVLLADRVHRLPAPDWLPRTAAAAGYRDDASTVPHVVASEHRPALVRLLPPDAGSSE